MTRPVRTVERSAVALAIAILCSELLLLLSFVRLWGDANSAVFHIPIIDATLSQAIWGTALARRIGGFVGALIVTHLLLAVAAWGLAKLTQRAWPRSGNSLTVWTLFWLVLFAIWVLTANAAWFPSSSLGSPYAGVFELSFYGLTLLGVVTAIVVALVATTFALAARDAWLALRQYAGWAAGALAAGAAAAAFTSFGVPATSGAQNRPNVIVIGLDSLRPDALGHGDTPNIDAFLSQATVFADTLTPLARTFPAWVSILSGKHPHTTGAVNNLLARELIDEGDTLPRLLDDAGYHTVFATDEVRFSNIDETYGFAETIAPPMGAADFLLGFFGDSPLANLLVNTPAGEWLFPQAYANRAAAVTYDPDTFIERLDERLTFDTPTFLAVHLTLAHWPYSWASTPPEEPVAPTDGVTPRKYLRAVRRVDSQLGDLIELLRERGALKNAIVVLLSDHGESLGEPISIAGNEYAMRHMQSVDSAIGHGTNVFAREQYRVLLAMRSFGAPNLPTPSGTVDVPASLEDVSPTLAAALDIAPGRPFEGVSWLPLLQGAPDVSREGRVRYMETEFAPPGFASGVILSQSRLVSAAGYYRIDAETDRVLIRAERLDEILRNRQYAATRGTALLAAVPSESRRERYLVYLEHPGAAPVWLPAAPTAVGDLGHDLWTALTSRFDVVREQPVLPPQGSVE